MELISALIPSISIPEIIVRTVIVYLFIVVAIRLFGKREIAQLSITDLVLILLISNSVQSAMVGVDVSLAGGLAAAVTLFLVNFTFGKIFYKSKTLTGLIEGHPLILIYEGEIMSENLKKVEITKEELAAVVREHGVEKISEVNMAVLETDGNISVLSDDYKKRTKRRRAHKVIAKTE
jgi:uncharacterized membrane protein YcaP (DUF421 family)